MNTERTLEQEKEAIDKALDEFSEAMRARLHVMADKGKRGWDDPRLAQNIARDMSNDAYLAHHSNSSNKFPDIANRAMMLWWQITDAKYNATEQRRVD